MNREASLDSKWRIVERCPACGGHEVAERGLLPDSAYMFGEEKINFPAMGVPLATCAECSLTYKGIVPEPAFIAEVFSRQAGKKWTDEYAYKSEIRFLKKMVGSDCFDLLDVGAANGALLKACREANVHGRRSGLDIIAYPGLQAQLSGELIEGFLDSPNLRWSGAPYQAVTLFDILEHLYEPQIAFQNLFTLVEKGGLVVLETGNVESYWPARFGRACWWYVRLFEHHIFWSRRALSKIANRYGFTIALWQQKQHKNRASSVLRMAYDWVKVGAYRAIPRYYSTFAARLGKQGHQPCSPLARDHFRVCLRKV